MTIRAQADALGFSISGRLIRYPEGDLSRYHYCYLDEDGNVYFIHFGVLTIVAKDGSIV